MCGFGGPQSRVYLPGLNISNVDIFSVNVTILQFGSVSPEFCVKFSSDILTDNELKVGTNCSTVVGAGGIPRSITKPKGMNWAYVVVKEPAHSSFFCCNLVRITVKYSVCPCKVTNLVQLPETVKNSTATVIGSCVDNAFTESDLTINTSTCSLKSKDASCQCNPGYELYDGQCKRKLVLGNSLIKTGAYLLLRLHKADILNVSNKYIGNDI